jgi:predicted small secreted protein
MRKVLLLAAVGAGLLLAGCNTISGMGRDLSAAGQAVSGAARH